MASALARHIVVEQSGGRIVGDVTGLEVANRLRIRAMFGKHHEDGQGDA
ncbi:MAG TPA: hypothetical protein VGH81_01230 [Rudaea sp.]